MLLSNTLVRRFHHHLSVPALLNSLAGCLIPDTFCCSPVVFPGLLIPYSSLLARQFILAVGSPLSSFIFALTRCHFCSCDVQANRILGSQFHSPHADLSQSLYLRPIWHQDWLLLDTNIAYHKFVIIYPLPILVAHEDMWTEFISNSRMQLTAMPQLPLRKNLWF